MAIPSFLAELRSVVGTRPLWLSGVGAVVRDEQGRVLLNRRSDSGRWSIVGGILDPGEQPADGLVREVFEETGLVVEPEALASVTVSPLLSYPNGDQAQYLDLTFRCRQVSGDARVNDDESLEVAWFAPTELPELDDYARYRLELALAGKAETVFSFTPPTGDPA
ncbi:MULTISPECIES: NUDIX domain-containing protein [unclassified Kitasatospora]|uniref:NUDIX hydrolase n=1 Tax=unclassified Kitasatospora TaxID=2633591 RepID=UPI00070F7036|nr:MULTISPECIES: NUDIX domain-containing protein [unclassified Kitasatospora]KQV15652.1 NUDIX hydrolase [Kitasatospora sp. Root107]KRB71634.1 NUDIX hydrolase [Kitasatospora sp. Root187]